MIANFSLKYSRFVELFSYFLTSVIVYGIANLGWKNIFIYYRKIDFSIMI